jgi:5-methyltetrahydrofolate--homocysteine methyltransferase
MGSGGIPPTAEERLEHCGVIAGYLGELGIPGSRVLFDPLVLPISVDGTQGQVTLGTLQQIKQQFPNSRTVLGLSNVSYGLPGRPLVNRAFLMMAMAAGLDAVILDPLDPVMTGMVKAADALLGHDLSCRKFLRAHRKGLIAD